MGKIKIVNKIGDKIDKYRKSTGATKTWIAKQMGYNSVQALDSGIKNTSNSLETYARFSIFLDCKINELFEIIQVNN